MQSASLPQFPFVSKILKINSIDLATNLSNIFNLKLTHSITDDLEGTPLIKHYKGSMECRQVTVKRVMDIVISAVLMVIISPIALFTAIAIKINSPGPVHAHLYIQERDGLNNGCKLI